MYVLVMILLMTQQTPLMKGVSVALSGDSELLVADESLLLDFGDSRG